MRAVKYKQGHGWSAVYDEKSEEILASVGKLLDGLVDRDGDYITLEVIRGPLRYEEIFQARRDVARLLRNGYGWSFPRIAAFINRDHGTVINMFDGPYRSRKLSRHIKAVS